MGDGIGTHGEVLWLERVECALFEALHGAICAQDYDAARHWVELLERLSLV